MQYKVILDISEEPEIREYIRIRDKALHDEASALGHARREGFEEGFAEGLAIGYKNAMIADMVDRMRALGVSEEVIERIVSV